MVESKTLYKEFGIVLGAERRRKHFSQERFAVKVGLSRTSVTNIECGRQPIQLHQLYLFAAVLDIEPSKLLPHKFAIAKELGPSAEDSESKYLAQLDELAKQK